MNTVQPIRDPKKIQQIESNLKSQSMRDYILFKLGINSGLRISDILNLKVKDIRNQDYFTIRIQKTSQPLKLKIQPDLKKELKEYLKDMKDEDFVIGSQKYNSNLEVSVKVKDESTGKSKKIKQLIRNTSNNSPIKRQQAWRILNNAAKQVGIKGEVGTHTLRKTFGYFMYQHCKKDITLVQKLLGHTTPQHTLRYIGIIQDDLDSLMDTFKIG